jgi:hypothetical protein
MYTKYNSRRKPELLDANTYSLHHFNEAGRVTDDYNNLLAKAEEINNKIGSEYKDAYFQLVLHPIKASANLYKLYTAVAYNRWFASQKWLMANKQAAAVREYYEADSLITLQYHQMANGKWDHMMDQTHIGYTYWQQPPVNKMPQVLLVAADSAEEQASLITPNSITAESLIPPFASGNIFFEKNGYVSIEAEHYSRVINGDNVTWQVIPNLGRTLSAITPMPATAASQNPGSLSPQLAYEVYLYDTGFVKIHALLSPTLPYHNKGLRFAISLDEQVPTIVDMHEGFNDRRWNQWVANNIIEKISEHRVAKPGKHTLKFWMVDAGVVLQKLMIDAGGLLSSYLGPEETIVNTTK